MEFLTHVLTVVWALRWFVALAVLLFLAWVFVDLLDENRRLRREVRLLERSVVEGDESIRRLQALIRAMRARGRAPIIAGRMVR